VPTYTGCPGKQAVKRVSVYLRYRCTDANSIATDYFRHYELRDSLSDTALLAMTSASDRFISCRTAVSCSLSATTKLLVYTELTQCCKYHFVALLKSIPPILPVLHSFEAVLLVSHTASSAFWWSSSNNRI